MKQPYYRIEKTFKWEAAHVLRGLPEGHDCGNMHGHSYRGVVRFLAADLDDVGMVIDFTMLKAVKDALDHKTLNDIAGVGNPTAENIARWIARYCLTYIFKSAGGEEPSVWVESVRVHETDQCWAEIVYPTPEALK